MTREEIEKILKIQQSGSTPEQRASMAQSLFEGASERINSLRENVSNSVYDFGKLLNTVLGVGEDAKKEEPIMDQLINAQVVKRNQLYAAWKQLEPNAADPNVVAQMNAISNEISLIDQTIAALRQQAQAAAPVAATVVPPHTAAAAAAQQPITTAQAPQGTIVTQPAATPVAPPVGAPAVQQPIQAAPVAPAQPAATMPLQQAFQSVLGPTTQAAPAQQQPIQPTTIQVPPAQQMMGAPAQQQNALPVPQQQPQKEEDGAWGYVKTGAKILGIGGAGFALAKLTGGSGREGGEAVRSIMAAAAQVKDSGALEAIKGIRI